MQSGDALVFVCKCVFRDGVLSVCVCAVNDCVDNLQYLNTVFLHIFIALRLKNSTVLKIPI